MGASIIPYMGSGEFMPAKVRLIVGSADLLLGIWVVNELRLTVDFGTRYFFA